VDSLTTGRKIRRNFKTCVFMLVRGMRLYDRLSGVRGAFVRESVAKQDLQLARGAFAASCPITDTAQRQVSEHFLANGCGREIQRLANV